jgi:site-specific DNA-methyltransferase (adenine-specific)
MQMTFQLIRYDAARRALAAAVRVDEAKKIRDRAEAVRVYAAQAKDFELQNRAATIRLLAERRTGQLLLEMTKNPGNRGEGRPRKGGISKRRYRKATAQPPTLEELNITKVQSSKWQRLARLVDDASFEEALNRAKETFGELTTAGVLWAVRDIVRPSAKRQPTQATDSINERSYFIHRGNVLDVLPTLPSDHFGGALTDPPYELGFSGKGWDKSGIAFHPTLWSEIYRVLMPGAYLLAFGGSRTFHRLTCAIEDAGFEIRDHLMWLYATGFPKSRATLKPSYEPIVLARKPSKRGLLLNTDECRINPGNSVAGDGAPHTLGRYPTNVILDEETAGLLGKPSRFFYCPKSSRQERDAGLESFAKVPSYMVANGSKTYATNGVVHHRTTLLHNPHPTVKPLSLDRWLASLIKPESGGRLLVPFSGAGSEMIGGLQAGWDEAVGIELSPEFILAAEARIEHHVAGNSAI